MTMLLRASERDSLHELELRKWLVGELGEADEATLSSWIWERHQREPGEYVDVLAEIVRQGGARGKAFVGPLLDLARKPREVREAEIAIAQWVKPRLDHAVSVVRLHGGSQEAAEGEYKLFLDDLTAMLRGMYPLAHRATMTGALASSVKHGGGSFTVDAAKIVHCLGMPEPLAATAAGSWG